MTDDHLIQQVEKLLSSGRSRDEILLETCRLLQKNIPKYTWVGFYLVDGNELILGPFVGRRATSRGLTRPIVPISRMMRKEDLHGDGTRGSAPRQARGWCVP